MPIRTSSNLVRSAAWLALAALTLWTSKASDRASAISTGPAGILALEDVVYQTLDHDQSTLDIYVPPGSSLPAVPGLRRPAILAIHGGSWVGGSKRSFRPRTSSSMVSRLTQAGYVVIAVDYRLARPGSPGWPHAVADLRAAVRGSVETSKYSGSIPIE